MKIGPLELRRRAKAAAEPEVQPHGPQRGAPAEIGASGTLNLSGFLQQSDYDHQLRGREALKTWQRMMRSDASVREAVDHIIAPVKNAGWEIDPATSDPVDLEVAEFARRLLFDWMNQPWIELVEEALEYLTDGHAVFEPVYQIVEDELTYTDPESNEPVTVPSRQFLALTRLARRLPETIWKWNASGGVLESIEQQVFKDDGAGGGGFQRILIPVEQDGLLRLLVLTNRRRGDEFTGQSILRPARKPWLFKELIEKIEGIALERWGVGIPIAYPPDSAREDTAIQDALETILSEVRAGEFTYIVSPGPKATSSTDGYLFEVLGMTGSAPNFTDAKNYHRAEIKAAVLARFSELGHASVGARATGDIQSVVWFAALQAVATYLEQAFQQVIVRLVDLNYTVTEYPTLQASGVQERNLAEFAVAISQLVSSGAMIPDQGFRKWAREVVDAPDEDEGTQAAEDANNDLAMPPPPAPPDPNASPPPAPTIEKE
jgi:hypothetical protein